MTYLEELNLRMKDLLQSQCNTKGCKNCGYKYRDTDCSMTELQYLIMTEEML